MKQYCFFLGGEDYFCLILCITYQSKEKKYQQVEEEK